MGASMSPRQRRRAESSDIAWLQQREMERAKYLRANGVPIRIVVIAVLEAEDEPAVQLDEIPECMR